MTAKISIHRFTSVQTEIYILIYNQPEKNPIFQARAVIKNMVMNSKCAEALGPCLLLTNQYMVNFSLYLFSKPSTFDKVCLEILFK